MQNELDQDLLVSAKIGNLNYLKRCIDAGANIETKNINGMTPLIVATENRNMAAIVYLLDSGADINASDDQGWTPLFWAASAGNLKIFKLLFERGANVFHKDMINQMATFYAVHHRHILDFIDPYLKAVAEENVLGEMAQVDQAIYQNIHF